MPLYTFVLDYDGGTYVAQVNAESFDRAPAVWARSLGPGEIRGMGSSALSQLVTALEGDAPTPLEGLVNVWQSMANHSLNRTRNGIPPSGLITLWPCGVLPLRAASSASRSLAYVMDVGFACGLMLPLGCLAEIIGANPDWGVWFAIMVIAYQAYFLSQKAG
eukprot:gene2198-2966_t